MRIAAFRSGLVICALAVLMCNSAHAALFEFVNESELDHNAGPGTTMTVDGLTLETVDIQGPVYTDDGMGGLVWDGVTKQAATGTNIPTGSYLAVNSASPQPAVGDPERWEVGEEWTFKFDSNVIFNLIDLRSFSRSNDNLTVTIDADQFVFTGTEGDDYTNPFGGLYIVEAGTNINFNHAGTPDNAAEWYGLVGLTVTPVGDIIDSVMSGAAETGTTWESGAPVVAGNLYRVVDGHNVSINAPFAGLGLIIDNGTVELNTGTFTTDLVTINANGTLNCSASGDIELGDVNTLAPMTVDGVISVNASAGADLFLDYDLIGSGEIDFESNGSTSDLWLSGRRLGRNRFRLMAPATMSA